MDEKLLSYLNPKNFKVDDRNLEDLILFVQNLSKQYHYFNQKDKSEGDWFELFASDESFLLADISKFEVNKYDAMRLKLTQNFDEFSSLEDKKQIFKAFFELIFIYFEFINNWYVSATRNNISQQSSEIELAIEQTILNKLKVYFKEFAGYYLYFEQDDEFDLNLKISFKDFKNIWNIKDIRAKSIFNDIDPNQPKLSSALKKLILLYTPIFKSLTSLQLKAKKLLNISIDDSSDHKAHVGLLITFLKLYEFVQNDLNTISKKHLDFYYKEILGQKAHGVVAKNMHVYIQMDQNIEGLTIDRGKYIVAGQNEDGTEILYETEEEISLNNVIISELSTLFLSRNNYYDFNSGFKLVSGIFSKTHCANSSEVIEFNENNDAFSTLGEEQLFSADSEKTMNNARIGFAISSPTLVLGKSNRDLLFNFYFTSDSIKYLSNLIIDISNKRGVTEEEVFSEIFKNLFTIEYTNVEGWIEVTNYDVEYPSDWTLNIIGIRVKLAKQFSSVDNYQEDTHKSKMNAKLPVFQFLINTNNFFYPYSFLSGMKITKIEISVKVKQLKNLKAINKEGVLDLNSEFDMLGVNPIVGSTLMIGTHEIFCKKIMKLSIGWDYTNLPNEFDSMEDYYKTYNREIIDDDFKLKVTALSDFTFNRSGTKDIEIEMFELTEEGKTLPKRIINDIDIASLNLKPNYTLKEEDLLNYTNDDETGYLKMELVSPKMGFGSSIFSSVYDESLNTATAKVTKKNPLNILPPNEPYSPVISNIFLNYESNSSLFFSQSNSLENDLEQDNKFFLISPFGIEENFSKEGIKSTQLITPFNYEGEFIIGLENIKPPQILNLLIEIKKSGNENYAFTQNLEWLYSSNDEWKAFSPNDIIYDETINLTKTGVISISIPVDITNDTSHFNNDKYYIKACSKTQADQFSLVKAIYNNGLKTVEFLGEIELEKTEKLNPYSVEDFKPPIPGVINIIQPMKTFGGKDKENILEFYKRVSHTLHHRNRPVTKSDIEKFTLQRFNWLSHVKCYSKDNSDDKFSADNIQLLCLKKIDSRQNIDEVKLSAADKTVIKSYLVKIISPFAKIEIISPQFEDIWIKCEIKFIDITGGKGIVKLNQEFFNYLCPWAHLDKQKLNLGGRIKKSEIIHFIKSRPYISFVTGISIIHIKTLNDSSKVFYDSAVPEENSEFIETGTVQSLLVPRKSKIIQLDQEIYSQPKTTDFSELGIGENFIISSGKESNEFKQEVQNSIEKDTDSSPMLFKIKF